MAARPGYQVGHHTPELHVLVTKNALVVRDNILIILVVTRPELRQWLCVDKLAVCCPPDHFGQDCKPCDALGSNGNQIIRSLPLSTS